MTCTAEDNPCFIGGDDLFYDVQFVDSDGEGIDLTGASAKMELRDKVTDVAVVQLMSGGIVTPLTGSMRFTLTDDETLVLLPRAQETRSFAHSVKLTFSDATEQTILAGILQLDQAATA